VNTWQRRDIDCDVSARGGGVDSLDTEICGGVAKLALGDESHLAAGSRISVTLQADPFDREHLGK
jgi:hypothetical protein